MPQAGGAGCRKTDPCKQVSCWAGPDSAIHSLFAKLFAQTILFEQGGRAECARVCLHLIPILPSVEHQQQMFLEVTPWMLTGMAGTAQPQAASPILEQTRVTD